MYSAAVGSVGNWHQEKEVIQPGEDVHTGAAVLLTVLTVSRVSGDGSWRSGALKKKTGGGGFNSGLVLHVTARFSVCVCVWGEGGV